ncbi:hypothetical protein L3X38_035007 [Prunus dulcis]|uniref:Uncharacterized protein n=1 Tax=Prunus dulcis TaxID=3755 RepID=A0AAD4VK84_PRUDU|nr:hypothetical protein L3X38_035007 [Prunus dulcis]
MLDWVYRVRSAGLGLAVRQHTFGRFGVAVVSGLASARRRIGAVIFREPSSNLSTALAVRQGWLVINLRQLLGTDGEDQGIGANDLQKAGLRWPWEKKPRAPLYPLGDDFVSYPRSRDPQPGF